MWQMRGARGVPKLASNIMQQVANKKAPVALPLKKPLRPHAQLPLEGLPPDDPCPSQAHGPCVVQVWNLRAALRRACLVIGCCGGGGLGGCYLLC